MLKKKKIVHFYSYKLGFVLYMKREFISHTKKEKMNQQGKGEIPTEVYAGKTKFASDHISREIILVQPGNPTCVTILLWGHWEWHRFESVLGQDTESKDRDNPCWERGGKGGFQACICKLSLWKPAFPFLV